MTKSVITNLSTVFSILCLLNIKNAQSVCDRSPRLLGAEDACWANKVKITDRIQYTTKSVLNFAKEKLGLSTDPTFYPQQCNYYQCIFEELKMLNGNGYPDYDKLVQWIDNNVIYNDAKKQYNRLKECDTALSEAVGDLIAISDTLTLQNSCEILKEFMKCLAINGTECVIFNYP